MANAVRLQPDGKIVAAGYSTNPDLTTRVAVVRLNPDGSLDGSFDGDGVLTTVVPGGSSQASAVAVQTLGGQTKIVVAGMVGAGSSARFLTLRYNANGSLDAGFSGDGIALSTFSDAYAYAVAVQADGKIVVGGEDFNGTYSIFTLVRYTTSGNLDPSFGSGGKVEGPFGKFATVLGIALQPDGKIIAVGGRSYDDPGSWALARFNANGSLNASLAVDDWLPGYGCGPGCAALQPDGKIVVGGVTNTAEEGSGKPNNRWLALARLNPDFTLDASFGRGGLVTTDSGERDEAAGRVSASGSRIVAAGVSASSSGTSFLVDRYFK